MSATARSWQGHRKVTARSNQLKMDENNLFLFLFLQLCPLKMSMVVQTYLEPSPVWCDRNWQNIRQIVIFLPISKYRPTIRVDGAQPNQIDTWRHALGLGFIGVFVRSWPGYLEVTARSNQLKVVKNRIFVVVHPIICTWDVYDGWKPLRPTDPNTEVHQTNPRRLHGLKGYYHIRQPIYGTLSTHSRNKADYQILINHQHFHHSYWISTQVHKVMVIC